MSIAAAAELARAARTYERHHPEETLLYEIVRDNLDAFLAAARERSGGPLPKYVEREFRAYLRCGILEHGFARLHCDDCNRDMLLAFSCKGRGLCPSCGARRMSDVAARLCDNVFPAVPVRQWVLALPYELRLVLARRADAVTAVARMFYDEVSRTYAPRADKRRSTGAITFVQRFGSMNLNVHLHVVFADGSFVRGDTGVTFRAAEGPTKESIERVAARVAKRVTRWLRRKGLLEEADAEPSPIDAVSQFAMTSGAFATVDDGGRVAPKEEARDDRRFRRKKNDPYSVAVDGFDVNAEVIVAAEDREGRERLLRYGARPPVALSRLSRRPDGRIAYKLKHPGPHGHSHRVMTPMELLARAAALIPPPRYPLTRYHGCFAPNSSWRKSVVPPRSAPRPRPACPKPEAVKRAPGVPLEPDAIARAPQRAGGERIDWATLLRRVYGVDALACVCGSRARVIATITEPAVIAKILAHVGEVIVSDTDVRAVLDWDVPPPDE